MILESCISQWEETNDLRAKGQAGFKKDFRTTNNLFILRTLTEQSSFQKKNLYTCFVDLKKAFDTVPRDLLWQVLEDLASTGGYWSVCAPCTVKIKPACTILGKGSRPLSFATSE
jgi:hypothetical protein